MEEYTTGLPLHTKFGLMGEGGTGGGAFQNSEFVQICGFSPCRSDCMYRSKYNLIW